MPWNWSTWASWTQNAILNLRDSVAAWGEREEQIELAEKTDRQRITVLESLLEQTRMDFFSLSTKVKTMSDVLDTLKSDFEAYQTLVTTTLKGLNDKVAALSAGALDPAKADAIDAEIKAAITALTPQVANDPNASPAGG
jgi:hypothetical protein